MIKFDLNHKSFDKSIINELGKKIKNIVISGVVFSSIVSLSGCYNNCDIKEMHVHEYVSFDDNFIVYASDDHPDISYFFGPVRYKKTDNCKQVTEEEKDLYEFMAFNGLIKIEDNEKAISNYFLSHNDEPLCEYEYYQEVSRMYGSIPQLETLYLWTRDSNHLNLTGKKRVVCPVYYGYNIVMDENNKYTLVKSEPFTSYSELIDNGYEYISSSIQDFMTLEEFLELKNGFTK